MEGENSVKAETEEFSWWNRDGPVPDDQDNSYITRKWFPQDFIFGPATSCYQVEGAYAEDGKGINIWDDFTMRTPARIDNGTNGVVACDMYRRYKEDIRRMKQMGFDSYRFSISWTRILPGMEPCVTIFHWDTPDSLEKEYGGFMSSKIKHDFREFAEICFNEFGDRVKLWCTLNEPLTYSVHGYAVGTFPPGKELPGPPKENKIFNHRSFRVPQQQLLRALVVDQTADPKDAYNVAKNLLLAHAQASLLYKTKFKEAQHGKIGMALNTNWCEPLDETSSADIVASRRAMDFMIGWFLDPALNGKYPDSMVSYVDPKNLEPFSPEESDMLKDSIDFLGLNYYTAQYVSDDPDGQGQGYGYDQKIKFDIYRNGKIIGEPSPGSEWLHRCPWGLYYILQRIKLIYPNLKEIYITENGCSDAYDFTLPAKLALNDSYRKKYYQDHLANLVKVIKDTGVNVKGYYAWSWCDNFEWNMGYSARFGLVYIDYMNNQTRYPKDSCAWFAEFFRSKREPPVWLPPVPKVINKSSKEENVRTKKRARIVEDEV